RDKLVTGVRRVLFRSRNANSWQIASGRLSTQITSRNKLNIFWDEQHPCNGATWTPNGQGCRKPSGNEVFESVFGSPNTTSPEAEIGRASCRERAGTAG